MLIISGLDEISDATILVEYGGISNFSFSNKILVSAGAGILTIKDKYMEQFNSLLLEYYDTGASEKLKHFLYEHALQGMNV